MRGFAALRAAVAVAVVTVGGCARVGMPLAEIDAIMRPYEGAVPGASVLVVRDGAAVIWRSYGLADVERRIPVTPASNFRELALQQGHAR